MLSAAIRIGSKHIPLGLKPLYSISNWKLPSFEIDTAGISGFMEAKT